MCDFKERVAVDETSTLLIMLIDLQKGTGLFCKKNLKTIETTNLETSALYKIYKKLWYILETYDILEKIN